MVRQSGLPLLLVRLYVLHSSLACLIPEYHVQIPTSGVHVLSASIHTDGKQKVVLTTLGLIRKTIPFEVCA